jgi:carboxylate-amine ligase
VSLHLVAPLPSLPHRFGRRPAFRVGVEEELFLVDADGHRPAFCADEVLRLAPQVADGEILGELQDGTVELATPVCRTAADAADRLRRLRATALSGHPSRLLGAGLHPTAPFGAVRFRAGARYETIAETTGGSLRQSAYCGVHVHVGMPDAETAIAAYNGMRKWVPLLQAMGANSPYWHGQDSGMASARVVRCHAVPRTGLPRAFAGWEDYSESMRTLLDAFGLDGPESLWWDVRPHPQLGTLEIRVADAQSDLDDLEAIVALTHCLVYHEALTQDAAHPPKELLDESCFQAARQGLDARISMDGTPRHMQDVAATALELAGGYARRLGCAPSLAKARALLQRGNGADRQRRAFRAGGMPGVLRELVRQTA